MAQPSSPSFHGFPKLPIELRLMIWRLSSSPRTVELRISGCDPITHDFVSETPALLLTNREAREEVRTQYTVLQSPSSRRRSYFNYELDTLHFRHSKSFEGSSDIAKIMPPLPNLDKFQRMSMGLDLMNLICEVDEDKFVIYSLLRSLRELVLFDEFAFAKHLSEACQKTPEGRSCLFERWQEDIEYGSDYDITGGVPFEKLDIKYRVVCTERIRNKKRFCPVPKTGFVEEEEIGS